MYLTVYLEKPNLRSLDNITGNGFAADPFNTFYGYTYGNGIGCGYSDIYGRGNFFNNLIYGNGIWEYGDAVGKRYTYNTHIENIWDVGLACI